MPNTPSPSNRQPSLFFSDCQLPSPTVVELEDPLGEQPEICEEPIVEEEEQTVPHTYTMVENRIEAENRNEGVLPIRETNGDTRTKNIIPSTLPYFHGLTSEEPDTFLFEFVVIYGIYDHTSNDQKLKLFPSTLEHVALRWFMGLPRDNITTWAQMHQAFNNKYRDY